MTKKDATGAGKGRATRWTAILVLFVLFVGAAIVYAAEMRTNRGSTPKVVNRPTEARQVRPLSEKPDKRFAPLPIEREKHDQ
jgi:hypothetical protein